MSTSSGSFSHLLRTLDSGKSYYDLCSLGPERFRRLPYSIRILLESAVRNCDGFQVLEDDVVKILEWKDNQDKSVEVSLLVLPESGW